MVVGSKLRTFKIAFESVDDYSNTVLEYITQPV